MDRFDCQYLMATFVNVYIASFIRCVCPAGLGASCHSQGWESVAAVLPDRFNS